MPTIIIYWSPGRTDEQKAKIAEKITKTLVEDGGAKQEDVLIIFQQIEPGDIARQGKIVGSSTVSTQKHSLNLRSDGNG